MGRSNSSDFSVDEAEGIGSVAEERAFELLDRIRDYVSSEDIEGVLGPVALLALIRWMHANAPQHSTGSTEKLLSEDTSEARIRNFLLEQTGRLEEALEARGIPSPELKGDFGVFPDLPSKNESRYLKTLIRWFDAFELESGRGWDVLRETYEVLIERLIRDSRDAGQFGTPVSIRSLMIDLGSPQQGEKIYDPCFGTGGLLSEALRRLELPVGPHADNSGSGTEIFGVEINRSLHLIGTARVLLSGAHMPRLKRGDALTTSPKSEWRLEGGFDLILADPPIGSFRRADQHINREEYLISARRTENLFVQHVLKNLRPGGRAVIVVPNGILFRSGSDLELRRLLVDEYQLQSVVGLPKLSFHTHVPGAIVSVRRGEPRNNIWFVSSKASAFNSRPGRQGPKADLVDVEDLPSEASFDTRVDGSRGEWEKDDYVFRLSRERIAERDYNLTPESMGEEGVRRFLNRITSMGHDVEIQSLGDVAHVFSGRGRKGDDLIEGNEASSRKGPQYLRVRNIRDGFIELSDKYLEGAVEKDKRLEEGDVLLTSSGTVGRLATVNRKFVGSVPTNGITVIRPKNGLHPEFVHRLLASSTYQDWIEGHSVGSYIDRLRITELRSLEIPIPPKELQETVSLMTDPGANSERILFVLSGEIEKDPVIDFLSDNQDVEELERGRHELEDTRYDTSDETAQSFISGMVSRLVSVREGLLSRKDKSTNEVAQKWAGSVSSEIRKIELGAELDSPAERLLALERVDTAELIGLEQNLLDLVSRQASTVTEAIDTLQNVLQERAYRQIDLQAAVDREELPVNVEGRTQIVFSLRLVNQSPLSVRDLQAKVVGSDLMEMHKSSMKVNVFQPGESIEWELAMSPEEYGTHQVDIRWSARRLDGVKIRGKEEATFDVKRLEQAERDESDTDIGENPYIIATPIDSTERPEMFKGREEQIEQIRSSLQTRGTNTVVLMEGNRRTGKTSILRRLEHPDVLSEEWIPVYCNFQEGSGHQELPGLKTEEVFYRVARELVLKALERGHTVDVLGSGVLSPSEKRYRVKKSLMREMRPSFSDSSRAFESLEVTVEAVRDAVGDRRLLLMLDEFDKVLEGIDSGLTQQTVPENFRSLFHDHKGISGIITGSRRIRRLREEKYSALFGIGLHIPVKALDKDAAIKLVTEPVQGQLRYTKEARSMVVEECASQPYLIQYLCHTIFQICKREEVRAVSPEIVDRAATDLVQDNEHFRHLWDEAGTDRKRYLVCLIDRLSEDERVTYDVLSEYLGSEGISTQGLDRCLEDLLEREILSREEMRPGMMEYRLEVPLFSRWLSANEDESIYRERVLENQEQ